MIPQNPRKRGGAQPRQLQAARARLAALWTARHADAIPGAAPVLASTSALPFLAPHLTDRLLREKHGGEVFSSVDLRAQKSLERIMAQFVDNHRGRGIVNASALLLERDSGECARWSAPTIISTSPSPARSTAPKRSARRGPP